MKYCMRIKLELFLHRLSCGFRLRMLKSSWCFLFKIRRLSCGLRAFRSLHSTIREVWNTLSTYQYAILMPYLRHLTKLPSTFDLLATFAAYRSWRFVLMYHKNPVIKNFPRNIQGWRIDGVGWWRLRWARRHARGHKRQRCRPLLCGIALPVTVTSEVEFASPGA